MTTAVIVVGFMSQRVVQIIDFFLYCSIKKKKSASPQTDGSLSSNISSLATDLTTKSPSYWTFCAKLNQILIFFFFLLFFFHVAPLLPTTLVLTLSGKRHSDCNFMLLLPWMLTFVHLLNPGQHCLRCVCVSLAFLGYPEHRRPTRILNAVWGFCNCSVVFIFITLWPLNFLWSWTACTVLSKFRFLDSLRWLKPALDEGFGKSWWNEVSSPSCTSQSFFFSFWWHSQGVAVDPKEHWAQSQLI